jgi:hypothetical protein
MEILNLKLISPNNCKILYRGEHKFLSRLNDREIKLPSNFIKYNNNGSLSIIGNVSENEFISCSNNKQMVDLIISLIDNRCYFNFTMNYKLCYSCYRCCCCCCCCCVRYFFNSESYNITIDLEPKEKNIKNKNHNNIDDIINSTVGLKNLGGTCSVSSIIQVLAHTNCFVHEFFKHYNKNKTISFLLYNLFMGLKSGNTSKQFSEFCNKLNSIIHVTEIDPMYFCTKFLEQ